MKNKLIPLGLLLAMSMSAFADQKTSAIDVLKKTQRWGLIQPGNMCVERYRFLPSGEVMIESNQERVTGTYRVISEANSFDLPAVVISFGTDNQQPDCAGSRENQAGTSTTNFLKKESDQKIYFCLDASGKNCPVYLRPDNF